MNYREHGRIIPSSSPSRMEMYLQRDAQPLSSLSRKSTGNSVCLPLCNAFLGSTKVTTLRREPKRCGQEELTVEETECKNLPLHRKIKSRGTTIFNNIWVWRKLIYTNIVLFFLKLMNVIMWDNIRLCFMLYQCFDLLSVELISFH